MTSVLVTAGFLGSGKTALLLGLGRIWTAAGLRVAVVENEVNTRGIDGAVLAQAGFRVHELVGGCICCSLAGDLRAAAEALIAELAPDILCIEPSGVAGAAAAIHALQGLPGISAVRCLAVIDAMRMRLLDELNPEYLPGLVESAQAIVLTKTDLAGPEVTGAAVRRLTTLDPLPALLPLDTADPAHLAELADLLKRIPAATAMGPGGHGITAAAANRVRTWPSSRTAGSRATAVLRNLAGEFADASGAVPGHIKAFIDGGNAGWWAANITHLDTGCQVRDNLAATDLPVTVTISAIVVGAAPARVNLALDMALGMA